MGRRHFYLFIHVCARLDIIIDISALNPVYIIHVHLSHMNMYGKAMGTDTVWDYRLFSPQHL